MCSSDLGRAANEAAVHVGLGQKLLGILGVHGAAVLDGDGTGHMGAVLGSHVSASPNHQLFRSTPLYTRANVACFGTFGYELDLNRLTEEEQDEIREQIRFMKQYRELLQFGTFYRLKSPFEGNVTVWMSVSGDRREAIVGWYRVLNGVNLPYSRVRLAGLDPDFCYEIMIMDGSEREEEACRSCYGDELMNLGLITSDASSGEIAPGQRHSCDFDSRLFVLKAR